MQGSSTCRPSCCRCCGTPGRRRRTCGRRPRNCGGIRRGRSLGGHRRGGAGDEGERPKARGSAPGPRWGLGPGPPLARRGFPAVARRRAAHGAGGGAEPCIFRRSLLSCLWLSVLAASTRAPMRSGGNGRCACSGRSRCRRGGARPCCWCGPSAPGRAWRRAGCNPSRPMAAFAPISTRSGRCRRRRRSSSACAPGLRRPACSRPCWRRQPAAGEPGLEGELTRAVDRAGRGPRAGGARVTVLRDPTTPARAGAAGPDRGDHGAGRDDAAGRGAGDDRGGGRAVRPGGGGAAENPGVGSASVSSPGSCGPGVAGGLGLLAGLRHAADAATADDAGALRADRHASPRAPTGPRPEWRTPANWRRSCAARMAARARARPPRQRRASCSPASGHARKPAAPPRAALTCTF